MQHGFAAAVNAATGTLTAYAVRLIILSETAFANSMYRDLCLK